VNRLGRLAGLTYQPGRLARLARMRSMGGMAGHYEVHEYPAAGHALKALVWVEPGRVPLVMTTIAPERLPLLADALNRHLADGSPPTP